MSVDLCQAAKLLRLIGIIPTGTTWYVAIFIEKSATQLNLKPKQFTITCSQDLIRGLRDLLQQTTSQIQ